MKSLISSMCASARPGLKNSPSIAWGPLQMAPKQWIFPRSFGATLENDSKQWI